MNFRAVCTMLTLVVLFSSFSTKNKPIRNKNLPKYFVEVQSGKVWLPVRNDRPINTHSWAKRVDSCETFYIAESEVSNGDYKLYLSSLKQNGLIQEYNLALPDTTVWRQKLTYQEPYVKYYFQHQAYTDYPVVGVSKKQALNYCKWLTDSLHAEDPQVGIKVTLPTRKQWIRAARGSEEHQSYAMSFPSGLRNSKGVFMYNHRVIGGENIYLDEETKEYKLVPRNVMSFSVFGDDGGLIAAQVKSYWPNTFGTYNMCGNVAELIADDTVALGGSWLDPGYDIRIESEKPAGQASCLIGFRVIAYINLHE